MAVIHPEDTSIQSKSNKLYSNIIKALNKEIKNSEIRDTKIAKRIGRTVYYVRKRLKGEIPMSLDDVLQFCFAIRINPVDFFTRLSFTEEPNLSFQMTNEIYKLEEECIA